MATEDRLESIETLRSITVLLSSMKHSIERWHSLRGNPHHENWSDLKELMLSFEDIRFSLHPLVLDNRRSRYNNRTSEFLTISQEIDYDELEKEAIRKIVELITSELFEKMSSVKFVRINRSQDEISRIIPNFDSSQSVRDIGASLFRYLTGNPDQPSLDLGVDFRKLKSILPPQKVAPIQFEIIDNKISLLKKENFLRSADTQNAKFAKEALLNQGRELREKLAQSNCDKRIIENIDYLHEQLATDGNIICLGLVNLTCEISRKDSEKELADVVNSMFRAHTHQIEMYAAQFPEWNRFIENAASAKIDQDDIVKIRDTASNIVKSLEAHPESVDPEVPKTLKYINELLKSPATASKKAAFAILRSIENFVNRVFVFGADFFEQTAKKTADALSSTVSKTLVVGPLTIALNGAVDMGTVAGKVNEMAWLKNAAELVKKQIDQMK